ncbi:hypothetical protein D3C75_956140 [compost metagenome]
MPLIHQIRGECRFARSRTSNKCISFVIEYECAAMQRENLFLHQQDAHAASQDIQPDTVHIRSSRRRNSNPDAVLNRKNSCILCFEHHFAAQHAKAWSHLGYRLPAFRKLAANHSHAADQSRLVCKRKHRQGEFAENLQAEGFISQALNGTCHKIPSLCQIVTRNMPNDGNSPDPPPASTGG